MTMTTMSMNPVTSPLEGMVAGLFGPRRAVPKPSRRRLIPPAACRVDGEPQLAPASAKPARYARSPDPVPAISRDSDVPRPPAGIVVGVWKGRYLRFVGQQFVLLAAPTRSGKGVGIVIPNLLSFEDSVVVLDIKQENYNITAGFRKENGQDVFLFNPFAEDFRTDRYNVLSAISDGVFRVGDILSIGYALYPTGGHDDFWKDQARNLFLAIVLLLCELRDARVVTQADPDATPVPDYPVTMGEVLRQSSGKGMPVKAYLQQVLMDFGDRLSGACIDALNRFLSNDDKVLASILATFNAPLTIWTNPIVDAATSANDFDLRDVRKKRMTIYIGITPDHLPEAALLVNLLFSQLVNLNTKQLPQDNPELKYQCLLLMDEFTAIGKVNIIAKAVSYMAGYNLRLLPIIQSVAQLESVYGREDARTFVTNMAMQILYAPREQKDANEYSEMLGYFTEKSKSISRPGGWFGKGGGPSESVSDQRRALLLPQELKEIGQEREIILLENVKPILADKIIYWRDPVFKARLRPAPPVQLLDIEQHQARAERRLRAIAVDDVDVDALRLKETPAEHLEVLQEWDERDLQMDLADISEEDAIRYVNMHLGFIGVPHEAVERAERQLSLGDLESAEIAPEQGLSDEEANAVSHDIFGGIVTEEPDGTVGEPLGRVVDPETGEILFNEAAADPAPKPKARKKSGTAPKRAGAGAKRTGGTSGTGGSEGTKRRKKASGAAADGDGEATAAADAPGDTLIVMAGGYDDLGDMT